MNRLFCCCSNGAEGLIDEPPQKTLSDLMSWKQTLVRNVRPRFLEEFLLIMSMGILVEKEKVEDSDFLDPNDTTRILISDPGGDEIKLMTRTTKQKFKDWHDKIETDYLIVREEKDDGAPYSSLILIDRKSKYRFRIFARSLDEHQAISYGLECLAFAKEPISGTFVSEKSLKYSGKTEYLGRGQQRRLSLS
mmetsp:Transcript_14382/g.25467  ORF Transcript_14382/g.25467 Transcript_14382/m.25467 type:complete len:192 (-) Transcript_14382:337-912(-)